MSTYKKPLFSACASAAALLIGSAVAGELNVPPPGPAPAVKAFAKKAHQPAFQPSVGEPAELLSAPPPLSSIPPMPMPYPTDARRAFESGPGEAVIYNPESGETLMGPLAEALVPQAPVDRAKQGGYYGGADGGPDVDETLQPAAFGSKTLINNVGDHPWRMNVKVAMRFGASWFVCSGGMRDVRSVQLAGHCVHQGAGGKWADEIIVYPGWDGNGTSIPANDNAQTYGVARGIQWGSWTNWTVDGNFDFDWGIVALDRPVGALTGWYGWQTGTGCPTGTYNVGAYPAEACGTPGLHNGLDMYYWSGAIDSCPGNQLQINTTAGCFTALWGGESGSNLYAISGTGRFVRGIASTSNRSTIGRYVQVTQPWVDYLNNTFIPTYARGATFDLQPLDMNGTPTTIRAGTATTLLNHLAVNGTNGTKNATFNYGVYLSGNTLVSTADTLLSSQSYIWNFPALGSVRVNMPQVTIPENTPPGTYWLGVVYAAATDGAFGNNDSSYWDAQQITVTRETTPPRPNPMTWSVEPFELSATQIGMTSITATDPVPPISYLFDHTGCAVDPGTGGTDSLWQSSRTYTDGGLQANKCYCYRVAARDGNNNVTSYSPLSCEYTAALLPGALAFANITQESIRARWTANGNPAGTQYYVENITAGTNSGWTTNTSWNNIGLVPNKAYSYRVRARNKDGAVTAWRSLGSATTLPVLCDGVVATIWGTAGNDIINGTPGPDVIQGRDGADVINGGGGADRICGGGGPDTLYGQGGNDTLIGGLGVDTCNGGPGSDSAATCETLISVP